MKYNAWIRPFQKSCDGIICTGAWQLWEGNTTKENAWKGLATVDSDLYSKTVQPMGRHPYASVEKGLLE